MSLIDVYPIAAIAPEPWRNGGGVTRTIATGGDRWRVSLADIERDGPYSRFPGISRVSLILGGAGVTLTNAGAVVPLRPLVAAEYDGDAHWNATLVDGPSVALNVMSAKGEYRVEVRPVVEPIVVRAGCTAIAIALGDGCIFAEGAADNACDGEVVSGSVLVAESLARPLRLARRSRSAGLNERIDETPYAVFVTLEPAPVRKHT